MAPNGDELKNLRVGVHTATVATLSARLLIPFLNQKPAHFMGLRSRLNPSTINSVMQANAAARKKQPAASRRSSSKSSGKRVGFVDEPILSSGGSSQIENEGRDDKDTTGDVMIDTERMGKIWEKLKEPDPWPRRFARSLRERQEEVVKRLKEIKETSAADTRAFETGFAPLIGTALGGIAHDDSASSTSTLPIHVHHLGAEGQPYCDAMIALMEQSGALLFAYDELAGRQPQPSRLREIGNSLNRDKTVTVATLEAGKRVAAWDIEKLLADRFQEVRTPQDLTRDDEHKGRVLLSRGAIKDSTGGDGTTSEKQPLGWGNLARDAEWAIERLCLAGLGRE